MQSTKVKELMVPLAEYATVSEDATLNEAILALEEAQKKVEQGRERHRAILVLDKNRRVVGKLTQWDVSAGIEPEYRAIENITETSRFGFSPEYLRSMMKDYGLWRKPLEDLCGKASAILVKDIMSKPTPGEYIEEDASLDEAIHLLVMGRHQSLIVKKGDDISGILRMSDVFKGICDKVKSCKI
ncbi:MAG: CBS domain-containing protein [Pseudomonadota bacterium]